MRWIEGHAPSPDRAAVPEHGTARPGGAILPAIRERSGGRQPRRGEERAVEWQRGIPSTGDAASVRGERLPSAVVATLVARAKSGDGVAFGQLYDRYVGEVYGFVAVRLRDQEAAQDMTQAIFMYALQSLASCREDAAFPGWLFAIARNMITDHYRAARFRPHALEEDFDRADPDLSPEEVVLQRDDARILREARERCLSMSERDLFDLLLTDLNDKQIGEALGRSHGAIRVAHHRLMAKLRECLQRLNLFGEVRGAPL
jgi:RNA polymerase sigma-70 factor (ECF subfamily)